MCYSAALDDYTVSQPQRIPPPWRTHVRIWKIFTRRFNGSAEADAWLSQLSDEAPDEKPYQDFESNGEETWLDRQYEDDLPKERGRRRQRPRHRHIDRESAREGDAVEEARSALGSRSLEMHHDDYPAPRFDDSMEQGQELAAPQPDPLATTFQITERSVIGDQIHRPIIWCQIDSCIASFSDPRALGEADNRALALKAGWREDKLGRMVCQACLQRSPQFRPTYPVALPRGSWM